MVQAVKRILNLFYLNFITKPSLIIKLIGNLSFLSSETYYPEIEDKKKPIRILIELLLHILKYGEINHFYFLYGFDIKSTKMNNYVPYRVFQNKREEKNRRKNNNSIAVLRDKLYFNIIAEKFGFKTTKIIGVLQNSEVFYLNNKIKTTLSDFIYENNNESFYFKAIDGQDGKSIFKIEIKKSTIKCNEEEIKISDLTKLLSNTRFIIERTLVQVDSMSQLFDNSINTLRVVTIKCGDDIYTLKPFLRMGTKQMVVDNWAQGGILVSVANNKGQLHEYGYYKPGLGTKCKSHPNTNVVFKDFIIPNYEKAIQKAIEFHNFLPDVHSIGWDICFTNDGIVFIEGNDNWEISPFQSSKGLNEEFITLFK